MTESIELLIAKYKRYESIAESKYNTSFLGWEFLGDRDRYPHFNDFYIPLIFSWAEDNKAKEDAISLFEKKHQIILPIEYKDFLMYVTNGNKITEQGTICKMLPLGSNISYLINENFLKRYINGFGRVGVLKEYLNGMKDLGDFDFLLNKASSEINPSLPFSYERDEGLIEAVGRAEYYPAFILEEEWRSANIPKIKKQLKTYHSLSKLNGCLKFAVFNLRSINCSFLLVVNGKEYGNVWVDMRWINKGIVPYNKSFKEYFFIEGFFTSSFSRGFHSELFVKKSKERYSFVEFMDDVLSEMLLWYDFKTKEE